MIKYNDADTIIMKIELYVGGENGDEIYIDRPITYDGTSPKIITPNDNEIKKHTCSSCKEIGSYSVARLMALTDEIDHNRNQVIEFNEFVCKYIYCWLDRVMLTPDKKTTKHGNVFCRKK